MVTFSQRQRPRCRGSRFKISSVKQALVDAVGSVGASAVAQGQFPPLEVTKELLPLLRSDGPILLGWPRRPATRDEGPVRLDCVRRVDRGVTHGGVDRRMTCDHLGDVGRQAVENRIGDEDLSEVMRLERQGGASWVGKS